MTDEPVIVAFLCNWCAYRAADLAGTLRLQSAVDLRIIRVMCAGRVEPQFVLQAFRQGADGVVIGGCHPGQCHYAPGNIRAMARIVLLRRMLAQLGINETRFRLVWASAAEGAKFAEVMNAMRLDLQKDRKALASAVTPGPPAGGRP
jgi:F420-non-reducing hydrogenase iron-sulfur subunit